LQLVLDLSTYPLGIPPHLKAMLLEFKSFSCAMELDLGSMPSWAIQEGDDSPEDDAD
jgi:hypothetical protein